MDSIDILGCRLDLLDQDEATDAILRYASEGAAAQVVTLGTEMVVYAQHDAAFRAVVNASALSLCDTVGLLAVARVAAQSCKSASPASICWKGFANAPLRKGCQCISLAAPKALPLMPRQFSSAASRD